MTARSKIQRFFMRIVPARWARDIETESRQWIARCACGHERSIWELGGIRWKAGGKPRRLMRCPACGQVVWHTLARRG